jgi:oligoendopeptidase F
MQEYYGENMNDSGNAYQVSRWSLGDLFPAHDSDEIKSAFAEVEDQVAEFESHRPQLSEDISGEDFMNLVRQVEEISQLLTRIGYFAGLWYTEDTQNQAAQNFQARCRTGPCFSACGGKRWPTRVLRG